MCATTNNEKETTRTLTCNEEDVVGSIVGLLVVVGGEHGGQTQLGQVRRHRPVLLQKKYIIIIDQLFFKRIGF